MVAKWFDDGVRVQLAISTKGDFVSLGDRTAYPFEIGGGGVPLNWTFETSNGGVTGDVNLTTQLGRFSISNISTTNSNAAKYYVIRRDFPVTYGHRYLLQVQSRTMDNKSRVVRGITYQYNGTGTEYGTQKPTESDWEQIALNPQPTSGITFIRVRLKINYYQWPGENEMFDWGGQWQNFALVDMLSTYPPPEWKDITCEVKECAIAYGRSRFTGRFEVATASIAVVNVDGQFTYQLNHPWGFRPGRFIKATFIHPDGTQYPAFYGLVDSVTDDFPIDGKAIARLDCIDTSSLLSNITVPTASSDTTTYYSGGRFRAVLVAAGWHPQFMSYTTGVYVQQGIYASGRTVRDELGIIADSEGSYFWCSRTGLLTYLDRSYPPTLATFNTVQAELLAECPTYLDEIKWVFPGVDGNGMSTPYDYRYNLTHYEWVFRVAFDDINGPKQTIMSAGNSWSISKVAGSANFEYMGVSAYVSDAPAPLVNGEPLWIHIQFSNSARSATFSYAPDNGPNKRPVSFVRFGNVITGGSGAYSATNKDIFIGANNTGLTQSFKGRLYSLTWLNQHTGGVILIHINTDTFAGIDPGVTEFTIPTGQTITVTQTVPNEIVQLDPVAPYRLAIVDTVPTKDHAPLQHLRAFETDWSRDRVINDIQLANAGGSAFQAVDFESQKKYGPRTYQRFDFVNDNSHPEYLTERTADYMDGWTEAMLRVNRVTFNPNAETYKWVMQMFMTDLVRVRYTHPTEGWGIAIASHIQGYIHNLTTNGWETSLNLDQPESFAYYAEGSGNSGWDIGYWDIDIWDGAGTPNTPAHWNAKYLWSNPNSKWG